MIRDERFSFTGVDSDLRVLRSQLARFLHDAGWNDEVIADRLLVADELASNVVMHARTRFDVRCVVDDHLELEVIDHDPGHLPVHWTAPQEGSGCASSIASHASGPSSSSPTPSSFASCSTGTAGKASEAL
jgi:anti-sigma regulatory factor (Ser/Thr protein kinase)